MSRKNRAANRAAGRNPEEEKKEQDDFIEEVAGEDFGEDGDVEEAEEEEKQDGEVTELDEGEQKREVEAPVVTEAAPVVKTDEAEGKKEAGKQEEVTSLGDEEDEAGVVANEKAKTPEEIEAERLAAEEAAKKPEPTTEEITEPEKKEEEVVEPVKPTGPVSDEEAAQVFTDWRNQTEELLATHHYALTQEQIDEFEENPAAFIPKAMSRVYMDSISAAFNQFTNYLPRMVSMVLEQRENMNSAEKAFFDRWPDLLEHRDAVLRLGMSYRQANPQASMDDFINEVGAQTMVALRKQPAPIQQAPAPKQQAKPFKPASGTPVSTPPPKKSDNVFEQLSSDFDMMEEELDDS